MTDLFEPLRVGDIALDNRGVIRRCFDGLRMESLDINDIVDGGAKSAARRELVIWSWVRTRNRRGFFELSRAC